MDLHQQSPSQGYDKQAFNISERARARTLLELLAEANANIKEGIDPQLLTQEEILQGQLDATEKQRLEVSDNPNSSAVEKAAIVKLQKDLLAQYLTLQNEIRAKSPRFAVLKYPQPLTLVQVQQQLLDPATLLLQYSFGKDKSFLWVVSRDGIQSHVLPSEKEIENQVKSWRGALLDKLEVPETLDGPASRLGRLLLEPAATALKSRRRVIVVPDGALTYAPFAALRLDSKPLVESHTLLQLPSSSTLALIRSQSAQRLPAPRGLAMVADPIFSGDDPRLTTPVRMSQAAPADLASLDLQRASRALPRQRSAGSGATDALPRLPGTRREAERILPLFPSNQTLLALDSQASVALLQSPSIKDYRYVHLATHGVFNTAEPALSGVILSLVDQQGRAVNGFLRLNEIFNLNLPAELVVLSACETGLGEQIRGEGMVGLTRGFFYAGSRRLLVSLWKVDDDATTALMTRFYQGLVQDKLSPAQALRAAQNHLRTNTNWDSPYFWSGFVLQGEW
jgi:CHAT domain-containing protein